MLEKKARVIKALKEAIARAAKHMLAATSTKFQEVEKKLRGKVGQAAVAWGPWRCLLGLLRAAAMTVACLADVGMCLEGLQFAQAAAVHGNVCTC